MNTSQLLAVDLVLAVLAAGAWAAAAWMTWTSTASEGHAKPSLAGLALLATAVALVATAARYALLPALAAGSWWFASERISISLPLTAIPAAWAAMAGVPFLLRRRNTGAHLSPNDGAQMPAPLRGRKAAVLAMVAAGAGAVGSLALMFVLGPFPALWTLVILIFLVAGVVVLAKMALFPRHAVSVLGPTRGGRRATAATALAGLMACTALGAGVFTWLGSRAADGTGIITAVGHHDAGSPVPVSATTPVTALLGDMPANATVRRYELTARVEQVTLPSGRTTEAWTFGSLPGPTLEARLGEVVEVVLNNRDVQAGVTLHWHGYDVPNAMDGVASATQDAVLPGQSMTYRFAAAQAGTYWYHTHQDSAEGVRKGLYGVFVVHDPAMVRSDADIVVAGHDLGGLGMLGSSDRSSMYTVKPGSLVRVRLINTDSLPQRYLVQGTVFTVAAVDGTEVNKPGEVSGKLLRLGAGGRYDLTFAMPGSPVTVRMDAAADAAVIINPGSPGEMSGEVSGAVSGEVSGAVSGGNSPSAGSNPEKGTPGIFATTPVLDLLGYGEPGPGRVDTPTADREEVIVLDRQFRFVDGVPRYAFTVNGAAYPLVPSMQVAEGDVVKVTIINRTAEPHPMHPHGHHVLVLSRNGVAPSGSPLVLDTVDIQGGEVWEVLLVANNPGIWMDHCHNLDHAAEGMMMLMQYEGVSSPFVHGGHAHNRPE
ncbi:multicopper oxidase family protein [Paenarthrobacter ureafaciens]|uniref:multicopper oxidase family protein n=1 Tax=Paenarthrobacter ureafaciens TaxID=37931 RepID=UPI00397CF009